MIFNERMETMEPEERSDLQLERLRATVRRVYERVPFYKERYKQLRLRPQDIHSLDDLERLPFTTKADLRDQYPFGLFACDRDEIARLHGSSGTRGKPTIVGYTRLDLERWAEICARAICLAGGRAGDIFHNAYGYGLFTGGLGMHAGAETMGALVVPMSGGQTKRQITLIDDFRPSGLACTPSYALHIAEEMQALGLDPSRSSLRYGLFGAEPWSQALRQRLESTWGLRAFDVYGLSEVMGPGVACECLLQDGLHLADDHFLAEIIDPVTGQVLPPGQEGELVFTSLTKEAFPVIRYRTGDLSVLYDSPCACGRTSQRMGRVKGRVDDMLIVRGVNVFPSELEAVLLEQPELAPHYQVVLTRKGSLDHVELHVEQVALQDETELTRRLRSQLKHALGITIDLVFHPPGTLPRSAGKAVRIDERR